MEKSYGKFISEKRAEALATELKKDGYKAKVKVVRGGEYFDVIAERPKSKQVTPKVPKLR